jgi:hypothetical protein
MIGDAEVYQACFTFRSCRANADIILKSLSDINSLGVV